MPLLVKVDDFLRIITNVCLFIILMEINLLSYRPLFGSYHQFGVMQEISNLEEG